MDNAEKLHYRAPEIVAIGDAVELTGAVGTPVRDNPLSDTPAYYNANPDPERQQGEVELD